MAGRVPNWGSGRELLQIGSPEVRVALAFTGRIADQVRDDIQSKFDRDAWLREAWMDFEQTHPTAAIRRLPRSVHGFTLRNYRDLGFTFREVKEHMALLARPRRRSIRHRT